MRLKGKVAVITAAASGMGKAGALLFAKEGAVVNILDFDKENGEKVVQQIRETGGEANFFDTNLLDMTEIKKVIEDIYDNNGKINVLWNHAGTPGPSDLEEVEESEYNFAMDLNLKSGFFTTQYVVPIMKQIGGGSIIYTASIAGLKASPFSPVYAAGKGAVVNIVRSLAVRFGSDNIRFNCICPGLVETPMMEKFLKRSENDNLEKNKQTLLDNIPLGRLAKPKDIANAALFLASDESEYISGINLPVDGAYLVK
ncbi:SDR family NAD(P)-dependent oxidoreductase [Neobacillus niacini]|uniref:SDR family NAD(P)-dependent oxidoreductase n=1 Tax=Neobacillus niacini TaxID=86668 RepID=UPI0021CB20EC|nr:SDR family oxidoreductase [Neobacillus niacini]MCM3766213.1 SDR family oxidoreductase [Neobacillus niacini]